MHKVQYYKLYGGIGNQLFQYAHGLKEIRQGENVRFVLNRENFTKPYFDLPELFTIDSKLIFSPKNKIELFFAKFYAKYICNTWHTGFFQEYKFAKELIDADVQFLKKDDYSKTETAAFINSRNAVSIHIRGGDYNRSDVFRDYGNICTEDYYVKAISEVKKNIKTPVFLVFTNDKEYAKSILKNLKDEDFIYIDDLYCKEDSKLIENDPAFSLYLQSLCKANIIANSTFSWWGAFFNQNPQKLVISPSKWHNSRLNAIELLIPETSGWRKI